MNGTVTITNSIYGSNWRNRWRMMEAIEDWARLKVMSLAAGLYRASPFFGSFLDQKILSPKIGALQNPVIFTLMFCRKIAILGQIPFAIPCWSIYVPFVPFTSPKSFCFVPPVVVCLTCPVHPCLVSAPPTFRNRMP